VRYVEAVRTRLVVSLADSPKQQELLREELNARGAKGARDANVRLASSSGQPAECRFHEGKSVRPRSSPSVDQLVYNAAMEFFGLERPENCRPEPETRQKTNHGGTEKIDGKIKSGS
jgi:hypothetical protein